MIARILYSVLALLLPPAAIVAVHGTPRKSIMVLCVWAVGVAVFLWLMAGPGLLIILLAALAALIEIWRR